MAKKKQELTPEERLAAALVTEGEQPYKLPEGWKWVKLDGLADIIMGQSPRGLDTTDDSSYTPLIGGAADMGAKKLAPHKYTKVVTKLSKKNDLVLCIRATLGRPVVSDGEYCLGRGVAGIRTIIGTVDWIRYYFIQSERYLYEHATGSTFLQVTGKVLSDMPVPYPSLSEQQRIVARIESLFAKLDAAKAKVQSVLDAHEARKAALLHEAIMGKFIGTGEREWKPLSEIVDLIRIGPFGSALHKEDYIHDGIPVVNPQYIVNQEICPDNRKSISESKADSLSAYKMCVNDIIIGRRGEMGRTAPVGEREAGWLCGTGCMLLRLKKEYNANFYSRVIASQQSKQYLEAHAVGSTMKNLNEKIIRNLPVPIYSVSEQQEIARILDRLLDREEKVRQSAESVLESIDRMKQSILARAFRGEL